MEKAPRFIEALGRAWLWPEADEKCHKVVFDWSKDLEVAYKHCRAFDFAVQAGGNMGVWPWLLAKKFKGVLTFEPDPVCFECLEYNTRGLDNVTAYRMGLMEDTTFCTLKNDTPNNLGAQYLQAGGGDIMATSIDAQMLDACDLIYLDIEGAEMSALKGAVETISLFKPVIVVEDKKLSERFGYAKGDIENWLAMEFGYKVVARPHRDVVLACG